MVDDFWFNAFERRLLHFFPRHHFSSSAAEGQAQNWVQEVEAVRVKSMMGDDEACWPSFLLLFGLKNMMGTSGFLLRCRYKVTFLGLPVPDYLNRCNLVSYNAWRRILQGSGATVT